jgi:hypothetical protein
MSFQERFESKFIAEPNSGCWLWTACFQPPPSLPYGRFQLNKRSGAYAHRVAYELYVGPIPDGLFVLHKCDTPQCVNTNHLFLGTKADNNRDKEQKGRANHAIGERNWNTTLTPTQVKAIKDALAVGASTRGLAAQYGVHRSSIMDIKRGRSYAYIQ